MMVKVHESEQILCEKLQIHDIQKYKIKSLELSSMNACFELNFIATIRV